MDFDLSKVLVRRADEISEEKLHEFYEKVYSRRPNIKNIWPWLYRSEFSEGSVPVILMFNEIIVAHISSIIFDVLVNAKIKRGQWLMDFVVHPDYQRMGLGHVLVNELEKRADFTLTCCNEKAIKILKGLGWEQESNSYAHYIFNTPMLYPNINRKVPSPFKNIVNWLSRKYFTGLQKKYSVDVSQLQMSDLNENNIAQFTKTNLDHNEYVTTVRNIDYLKWRFLESPHSSRYRIVKLTSTDQAFLIKLEPKGNNKTQHISVLMSLCPEDINGYFRLICTLGMFAAKNGYSYVQTYTNDIKLSNMLKSKLRSYRSYQIYAYHSHSDEIMRFLKNGQEKWELMDSDFERYDDY